ncbi:MAG TPA: tetratricopeptide repeat protein [Blastocatellia bacterium]|jgi:serine/threonine protein kinase/tetratricopeptide (TPR) repeat protein
MDVIDGLTKYRILEKIGHGGMGEVYRAEDLSLLRTVAIKVMPRHALPVPAAEARFLREARAASAINHPNIVTIFEIGETDQHAYIVMEYVRGCSLRDQIAAGSLTAETILAISIQICEGLEEAHARGVIHRDIKPENILITDRGQVKLVDFGLAKTLEKSSLGDTLVQSLTESGAVMGTLSYMSPEQLRGEELDERTDIFSFGIVLFEMVTGKLPFKGANGLDVAASILKDEAEEIGQLPPQMPRKLKEMVERLLEKVRFVRYRSFAEVKRDLQGLKLGADTTVTGRLTSRAEQTDLLAPDAMKDAAGEKSDLESLRDFGARASQTEAVASAARQSHARHTPPTVLVLPLESVGAEDVSFTGIGLAHAIITDLAKISGLSVLSKAAGAGRFDEQGRNARELAEELGASILLEGEVMKAGPEICIMARLIDIGGGTVIWGAQYRGDASDMFRMQDAVCEGVATALKVGITSKLRHEVAKPAAANIDAFEYYSKGRGFLERWDVEENIDYAIQMFVAALELDEQFALAFAGLGEAYWQKYQDTHDDVWIERAIAASDRALALDPRQAQVHVSLGIIYHGTGRVERAIEEFERAIDLQPLNNDAHKWLGRCYTHRGDLERAVRYFQRAIEIRPGFWDNYNKLGFCYYIFGRYREAAEQFRRVIAIQPDNYQGYDNLGGIYFLLGQFDDAASMHRRALEIYPNGVSYTNLGTALFYLGRYEEAIEAYEAALETDPHDEVLYRNLGDVYLRVGRSGDATEKYSRAVELISDHLAVNPDDARMLGDLAICQAKLNRKVEAVETIERAARLEPHNTTLMYEKAVVYTLAGNSEKALEELARALSHGYSRSEAERDPDLGPLRGLEEYRLVMASSGKQHQ